jgi:hypothetical protein
LSTTSQASRTSPVSTSDEITKDNLIFIHSSKNSSLSTPRRHRRGVEIYLHSLQTSALARNVWSKSRSGRLTPPGKNPGKKRCECPTASLDGFGDDKISDRASNSGSSTQSLHRLRHTVQQIGQLASYIYIYIYTGCPRRKGPNFGRVFLRSNYTDITQNTYIQSSMVTEILAREKCGILWCLRTVLCP